jgi:seryl-tRNA(Sec) selenium transferase
MDEVIKQLTSQAPMVALVTVALYMVYQDGKAERAKMLELLTRATDQLNDLKERIVRLEVDQFGEKFPTNAKRPELPAQTGVGS